MIGASRNILLMAIYTKHIKQPTNWSKEAFICQKFVWSTSITLFYNKNNVLIDSLEVSFHDLYFAACHMPQLTRLIMFLVPFKSLNQSVIMTKLVRYRQYHVYAVTIT